MRNVAEQISVLEQTRQISAEKLRAYLPDTGSNLPAVVGQTKKSESDFSSEREILYKVLFDMKSDLNDLKKLTLELMENGNNATVKEENKSLIKKIYSEDDSDADESAEDITEVLQLPEESVVSNTPMADKYHFAEDVEEEETLSLQEKELELIEKSLERHSGKRKAAAKELGISERTLYRKIKQYDL